MRKLSAQDLAAALEYRPLVERLRTAFREGREAPVRHHHPLPPPSGAPPEETGTLLLMPAWTPEADGEGASAERSGERYVGIKVATVFPSNARRSLPSVLASYLLLSGETGEPLALLDGEELTLRRTACASALAADYLARKDAEHFLMVGTGNLAPHLVRAHASVRPYRRISVWGRTPEKARRLAERLREERTAPEVEAVPELESAVGEADVISCATLARDPLVLGRWLRPGTHLDLVGAFTPEMRESDDEAARRARVHVDTREGALAEAGDVLQPLESGALRRDEIVGDLFQLTRGEVPGRRAPDEITLFKSVGTALEDLAAAELAVEEGG